MAEYIISFIILLLVSIVMILIGISQIKSKEPVGFYMGEKPPREDELLDIEAWNKKHGYMWIIYGLTILGSFILASLAESETIMTIVIYGVIVGALPIMMMYHSHLKKTYYK